MESNLIEKNIEGGSAKRRVVLEDGETCSSPVGQIIRD